MGMLRFTPMVLALDVVSLLHMIFLYIILLYILIPDLLFTDFKCIKQFFKHYFFHLGTTMMDPWDFYWVCSLSRTIL